MAKVAIFRIDEYGYPRFTDSGFMSQADAVILQARDFAGLDTEILTYGQFKARQDPDSMSESEVRRRFGSGETPPPLKRGVVVTGKIAGMTRRDVESALSSQGYIPQADVTGNTAFVVAGDKSGSKVARAVALGLPVKTWPEIAA